MALYHVFHESGSCNDGDHAVETGWVLEGPPGGLEQHWKDFLEAGGCSYECLKFVRFLKDRGFTSVLVEDFNARID